MVVASPAADAADDAEADAGLLGLGRESRDPAAHGAGHVAAGSNGHDDDVRVLQRPGAGVRVEQ